MANTSTIPPFGPGTRGGDAPWSREIRATVTLAGPIALTLITQAAILTTDLLMIGRLGGDALAAASLAVNSYFTAFLPCAGITMATAPLAAQAYGARRPRRLRRIIRQGLWISMILGMPAVIALLFAKPVLLALGQPAAAAERAQVFLDVYAWALPWSVGFHVIRQFAAVLGRPQLGLWVILMGLPTNALLDYGLIFGRLGLPRMELAGAGLVSVIVEVAMFLAILIIAIRIRPLRRYHILVRFWRPDWAIFRSLFRVGVPIAGLIMLEFGLLIVSVIFIGWIGTPALAAHQIAIQYASLSFRIAAGIGHAATVRIGHAAGRSDWDGVSRAGCVAIGIAVMVMTGCSILMWYFAPDLAGLFLDRAAGNEQVATIAVALIIVAAFFQIVDGVQVVAAGALRGLNDTTVPMLCAGFGYWVVGLTTAYVLAFVAGMGAVGVWWGLLAGLLATAVAHVARFAYLMRRRRLPASVVQRFA